MASHGVVRAARGERSEEARKKELEEIEIYRNLVEDVNAQVKAKEFTPELLQMTTELLKRNPEYYTAWNYRRQIYASEFNRLKTVVASNELHEDERISQTVDIIDLDLRFLFPLLLQFPKCYWIWNHRLWLLDQASELLPSENSLTLWTEELGLVGKMLNRDSRNFHGWGYRRIVVSNIEALSTNSLAKQELDYTTKMIGTNLSNFSAWHNRSKLILRTLEEEQASDEERKQMLDGELELIHKALFDPYDQSLWFYHQTLMCTFDPQLAPKTMAPNLNTEQRLKYLGDEREFIEELLEDDRDCKWVHQSLIELVVLEAKLNGSMLQGNKQIVQESLAKLKTLDPLRRGRWLDLEKSRFEDAADSKIDSKPESPVQVEHPNAAEAQQSKNDPRLPPNGNVTDTKSEKHLSQIDTDTLKRTSASSSNQSATDEQGRKSVKSMAASLEGSEPPSTAAPPKPPPRPSRFQGFSASLPSVPWGAPPPRKQSNDRATSPQPPTVHAGRKVTTPFGWFARSSSTQKEPRSPSLPSTTNDARRNTAASISTLGSNPELTLKALEEGKEPGKEPGKQSLREKFKALRMREEAGIKDLDDPEHSEGGAIAGLIGRSASLGLGIASPQSVEGDEKEKIASTPVLSPSSPRGDPTTSINPNLAPGTVSGIATSATDAATPIDWDFWQTVVNEGPQAVSRTSPQELAAAISSGIPQTIRGVIWQVLAGSKNDDLETVYHELRTRGTAAEVKEPPSHSSVTNGVPNDNAKEKESIASSKSSIKSEHSTPATSAHMGIGSPSPSHELPDPVISAKLQVQRAAERAKKAKEDAVALSKLEKMIKRDMGSRTSYAKYTTAAGLQEPLFNVCKAYALFDDAVGYPQGMNFIIMPLLFTMSEEEAFCLLVRLMNKYQLRELFVHDMPGLHLHLYQFERLLEDLEPALYCHLNRRGVTPRLYATQWFLTLFAYRFPLQLVMRVYDLVLCEGLEGAILKFGMAVIQRNVQTLLAMNDMQALTNFLKEKIFDVYIDVTPSSKSILESGFFGSSGGSDNEIYRADLIVQDASAIQLTPDMLTRYREEWEEKTTTEKARETELENLRTDTATKASQIRSLEQRAEKSDAEHIEIANELVKLKVENQELIDQNESLKGHVDELRKVADSEAQKVEERLRAGTEQVMQRNIEVQNENRHMEEQMTEMEKELVEMKLKFAELNGEHEGLKQKWNDLRKALE